MSPETCPCLLEPLDQQHRRCRRNSRRNIRPPHPAQRPPYRLVTRLLPLPLPRGTPGRGEFQKVFSRSEGELSPSSSFGASSTNVLEEQLKKQEEGLGKLRNWLFSVRYSLQVTTAGWSKQPIKS